MKPRTITVLVFLGVLFGVGLWWIIYQRSQKLRTPDIHRDGGTILVYEVEDGAVLDDPSALEDLASAVKARVRSVTGGAFGEVQTVEPRRIEITIPRGKDHADTVEDIKALLQRAGNLEFRILANRHDDAAAIEVAEEVMGAASADWVRLLGAVEKQWPGSAGGVAFDDVEALTARILEVDPQKTKEQVSRSIGTEYRPGEQLRGLRHAAHAGLPPAGPRPRKGQHFSLPVENARAAAYAWVRLARPEIVTLSRGPDGPNRQGWTEAVDRALHRGIPFSTLRTESREEPILGFGGFAALFYARHSCLLKDPQSGKPLVEYFVLTRLTEAGQEVTGTHLTDAHETADEDMQSVGFRLTREGGERLHYLTSRNCPELDGLGRRHLAIMLDDEVMAAPSLNAAIRDTGVFTCRFTKDGVRALARLLNAGALPVPLKPQPVSEETVEPGQRR